MADTQTQPPPRMKHRILCAKDYRAYVPAGTFDRGYCPECAEWSDAFAARLKAKRAEKYGAE